MKCPVPHDRKDAIPAGSQRGFIAFCETNLRYEKGFKAWVILGPYLLGAFALEKIVNSAGQGFTTKLEFWMAFLAYLIFLPDFWRRLLRFRCARKAEDGRTSSPKN